MAQSASSVLWDYASQRIEPLLWIKFFAARRTRTVFEACHGKFKHQTNTCLLRLLFLEAFRTSWVVEPEERGWLVGRRFLCTCEPSPEAFFTPQVLGGIFEVACSFLNHGSNFRKSLEHLGCERVLLNSEDYFEDAFLDFYETKNLDSLLNMYLLRDYLRAWGDDCSDHRHEIVFIRPSRPQPFIVPLIETLEWLPEWKYPKKHPRGRLLKRIKDVPEERKRTQLVHAYEMLRHAGVYSSPIYATSVKDQIEERRKKRNGE